MSIPAESLLVGTMAEWLDALPEYQRSVTEVLLSNQGPIEAATTWLEGSGPRDTAPFGGVRIAASHFYDHLLQELQKLLCVDSEYVQEKTALSAATQGGGRLFIVGVISTAIAPYVGAAAAVIGPAVAITLAVLSNAGQATACEALNELIDGRAESTKSADPLARLELATSLRSALETEK